MNPIARWRIGRGVARDLRPPPPAAFGAFGRSVIVPPARVDRPEGIHIGDGVVIHEHVWLNLANDDGSLPRLTIGDRTRLGRWCVVACSKQVTIGADVVLGDQVFLGDTFHEYRDVTVPCIRQPLAPARPVTIGDGAYLGTGAIVLLGVSVGASAIVEQGAVVTRDVPPGGRVRGNPAVAVA